MNNLLKRTLENSESYLEPFQIYMIVLVAKIKGHTYLNKPLAFNILVAWQGSKYCYEELLYFLYPVDTRRKLNVHKTFRRCPRRLLNVLCTFNLRPVFTGSLGPSIFSMFQLTPMLTRNIFN